MLQACWHTKLVMFLIYFCVQYIIKVIHKLCQVIFAIIPNCFIYSFEIVSRAGNVYMKRIYGTLLNYFNLITTKFDATLLWIIVEFWLCNIINKMINFLFNYYRLIASCLSFKTFIYTCKKNGRFYWSQIDLSLEITRGRRF